MKKILLSLLAVVMMAFVVTSCSSDDSSSDNAYENLIGTWNKVADVQTGSTTDIEDCIDKERLAFSSNGTLTITSFSGTDFNNCQEVSTTNGRWEYLGSNNYLIYPVGTTITNENRPLYSYVITFHNNNVEMRRFVQLAHQTGINSYERYLRQ
ncbi:MAG: lipocalin family protein [Weeksellaceae bacterium]|nr:lipocalin family protein [Weeksellaceae bacterium]